MFISASRARQRCHKQIVCALVIYTISGFVGCQATRQITPASVHVNTSWGSYRRRPPGGKIADDHANLGTLWFRILAFGIWGYGIFSYYRSIGVRDVANRGTAVAATASPATSPTESSCIRIAFPALATETLFYGCLFHHNKRYPGCSVSQRDLMMALEAISNDLRSHRFAHVEWTVKGDTSMSCRSPDGRSFRIQVPPAVEPQINAMRNDRKCGVYVKVAREPWEMIRLSEKEMQSLQTYGSRHDSDIFWCPVAVHAPSNSTDSTMTGFKLDFRGFISIDSTPI